MNIKKLDALRERAERLDNHVDAEPPSYGMFVELIAALTENAPSTNPDTILTCEAIEQHLQSCELHPIEKEPSRNHDPFRLEMGTRINESITNMVPEKPETLEDPKTNQP